jgi:hypothetical protein
VVDDRDEEDGRGRGQDLDDDMAGDASPPQPRERLVDGDGVGDLGRDVELERQAELVEPRPQLLRRALGVGAVGGELPGEVRRADHRPHALQPELLGERDRLVERARAVVQTVQQVAVRVDHAASTTER